MIGPVVVARRDIARRVEQLAVEISYDHQQLARPLILLGVLTGALPFLADLSRQLGELLLHEVDTIRVASYRGTSRSGDLIVEAKQRLKVDGRHVLIVDDIVDSGDTLRFLRRHFYLAGAHVRTCALLTKPHVVPEDLPDYRGFEIPDRFVVGYGLDHDEAHRYLPDVREWSDGEA